MIYEYFFISVLILIVILVNSKKENIEHFSDSNFKICDERDCDCLKLKTAPDGSCVDHDVPKIPKVPDYEDKIFYNKRALNNTKYPKRRKYDILIFVGEHMKNKKTIFNQKVPDILQTSFKTNFDIYSDISDDASLINLLSITKNLKVDLPKKSISSILLVIDQIRFKRATKNLEDKKYDEALKIFDKLSKKSVSPKIMKDSQYNKAIALYKMKKYEIALTVMIAWDKSYNLKDISFYNNILNELGEDYDYLLQFKNTSNA